LLKGSVKRLFIRNKTRARGFSASFGFLRYCLFPTQCGAGINNIRSSEIFIGEVRDSSGFSPAKDILGAPRRNVRTAERSSSCCSARNDAIVRCIVTLYQYLSNNIDKLKSILSENPLVAYMQTEQHIKNHLYSFFSPESRLPRSRVLCKRPPPPPWWNEKCQKAVDI